MANTEITTVCPYCFRENQVAISLLEDSSKPKDGNISICWGCGKFSLFAFNEPGNTRKPTFSEYITIISDENMQKALRVHPTARTPYEANRMMNEP